MDYYVQNDGLSIYQVDDRKFRRVSHRNFTDWTTYTIILPSLEDVMSRWIKISEDRFRAQALLWDVDSDKIGNELVIKGRIKYE